MVVAMLVLALCAALIVGVEKDFMLIYQRGANSLLAEQGHAYLRGAEELAAVVLAADYDADEEAELRRDDLSETWAQEAAPYALGEGGWMMGRLTDLQGRFNLNRLADPAPERDDGEGPRFTPAQEQFIRLLQSLDNVPVDQQQAIAITESISDWLDVDANARLEGAEDSAYFAREPAYRAANAPMASVSELQAVANMTPEIYAALASLVTVWPTSPQPLNVHTAPLALLRSINADGVLEPLDLSDTQQLVEYRQLAGFADMDDFFLQAALDADALPGIRPLLGESSSWFMLAATVEVADRQMRLYSVLQRRGRSISASVRASGSL